MSSHSQASCSVKPEQRLTTPFLIRFSLPLALTFLMMSGAAPLVSNGITWMHGAEGERIHLSAFLMCFVSALFLYSPIFIVRNVAIRTITDRRSLWAFLRFFLFWSGLSGLLLALVSRSDTAGDLVFRTVLGATAEQEALARMGLLVFIPIPALVSLRGLGQACHILNGQTWYVGFGTTLRLASMAVFVFGLGIHLDLTGPMIGGLTYLTGIGTETVFVLLLLIGKRQLTRTDDGATMSFAGYTRYAGPLMVGAMCHQLVGPMLVYIINHAARPVENGATYNLIRDTAWIMVSALMAIQPVVITHATSRRNLWSIMRFSATVGVLITAVTAIVALTPVRDAIFVGWMRVDNQTILDLLSRCLIWLVPLPAVTLMNHFLMSIHTRSGRTVWVTAGSAVSLVLLAGLAGFSDLSVRDGAVLAIIAQGGFQVVAALVQTLGLLSGGIRSAVDPTSMAEKLQTARGRSVPSVPPRTQANPASAKQAVAERAGA